MMNNKMQLFGIALLACLLIRPAVAEDLPPGEGYSMVWSSVAENGLQSEFGMRAGDGSLAACNMAKRSQVLPRVVPKGAIISPGGKSYEWTVTAVTCKPEAGKSSSWSK
jgi:hypothetical protein